MQRLISSAVLLFVVCVTTSSLAAEVQIDQHTLCPAALHAFDAKDSEVVQEFFQFIHNVFSELDAQYTDGGERALSKRLQDRSVAGYVVLGRCRQHPAATIYEEAVRAYHGMRSLAVPLANEPAKLPPPSEGNPRIRKQ